MSAPPPDDETEEEKAIRELLDKMKDASNGTYPLLKQLLFLV